MGHELPLARRGALRGGPRHDRHHQPTANADREALWIGTFRDVARYGQERDTHTLVVHEANERHVVFSLTDEMDDIRFDVQLTVKVRLPSDWSGAEAYQGGPVRARTVTHDGATFLLVNVVPDRGPVVVRRAS